MLVTIRLFPFLSFLFLPFPCLSFRFVSFRLVSYTPGTPNRPFCGGCCDWPEDRTLSHLFVCCWSFPFLSFPFLSFQTTLRFRLLFPLLLPYLSGCQTRPCLPGCIWTTGTILPDCLVSRSRCCRIGSKTRARARSLDRLDTTRHDTTRPA